VAYVSGCPRSASDTSTLFGYLRTNGWSVIQRLENADLIIVSACGFAARQADRSFERLGLVDARRKPDSHVIVLGCLAGIETDRLRETFGFTVVPPVNLQRLDEILGAETPLADIPPANWTTPHICMAKSCWTPEDLSPCVTTRLRLRHVLRRMAARFNPEGRGAYVLRRLWRLRGYGSLYRIRVTRGCSEECSYCAIRLAVGPIRSKPSNDAFAEYVRGIQLGYRRFEVLGEDVGWYGQDIGGDLVGLLDRFLSHADRVQFRIADIHPASFICFAQSMGELLAARTRAVHHVMVPVQSGSDSVLKTMCRTYTAAQLYECFASLEPTRSRMHLATHVLLGFPGETEEDFQATVNLLRTVKFDEIQVYAYTERPHTPACDFTPKVPEADKRDRVARVLGEFSEAKLIPC
jgi:tRNA A37 methylthiotransferase MiaB